MSQFFEQALVAKLQAIPELAAILGAWNNAAAIFKTSVPQTYDYGRNGPALTYFVAEKPMGHVLTGSDGTAVANTMLAVSSYSYGQSKTAIEAIWNDIDGVPGQ
jgi:hypothetical protein